MQKMSIMETKTTTGGSLSGSLLTGVGAIIEAITNFITSMAGLAYVFEGNDSLHPQGDFKFSKNLSFSWNDTKPKAESLVKLGLNTTSSDPGFSLVSHAYDLT